MEHTLMIILEKWKSALNKGGKFVLYLWISQRPLTQ